MDIQALLPGVSDVSSGSWVHSHSLLMVVLEVSDDSGVAVVHPVVSTDLDGDDLVSISESSNGLGSPVEDEPLSVVTWVVVLDSESVLMVTNVLVPEEGSVSRHS